MTKLPISISPYLKKHISDTGYKKGPLGKQFCESSEEDEGSPQVTLTDPQEEYKYEVLPGLIYKYKGKIDNHGRVMSHGRVLWYISNRCASYCRFCFRGRFVGSNKPEFPSLERIQQIAEYIKTRKEINEVILSGGDPLVAPKRILQPIFSKLQTLQNDTHLDIVRIHTHLPIHNPRLMHDWIYDSVESIQPIYIVLHINHSAELTPEVAAVVKNLRKAGASVYSQSVLLKGENDSKNALISLFETLVRNQITPYYLHQNDPVPWASHFTVPLVEAISLWQSVRPELSGLAASAKLVIDTPGGKGKIVIPQSDFDVKTLSWKDFEGIRFNCK